MNTSSRFLLCISLVLGWSAGALGGLVITDTDIVGGHYVYDLTFGEMDTVTVFEADVWQRVNCTVFKEPWQVYARFVQPTRGQHTASFVYKFDFSGTDWRPVHMDLQEYVLLVRTEDLNEDSRVVTAWSTDDVAYTTIQTCTSPVAPSQWANYPATMSVAVPGMPESIYYKVTMNNFDSNGFSLVQTQWNRQVSTSPPPDGFRVDFTVEKPPVPEPAVLGLLGLAMLGARRRRA